MVKGGIKMKSKIVLDSSGDLHSFSEADFACVPLTIHAGEREFVDDETLDREDMLAYLQEHKGKSTTSCPGVGDYLQAFGDADEVYCVTITSHLSGSYNAASVAARTFQEQHPDRRVHVFDSLSTGPSMILMAEKLRDLIREALPFEAIVSGVEAYKRKLKLIFTLESLHNLAANGRVPFAVAAVTGMLGIRVIGRASEEGKLEVVGKARGEKKLLAQQLSRILDMGYEGGKLIIQHCENAAGASALAEALRNVFPAAKIRIGQTGGLCSFYAERGGMIIGFEAN